MKPFKEYTIDIKAPADRLWYALWDDAHYRIWTRAFSEGSYAKTEQWQEGSRVHFLNPDGKGMYSDITQNTPNETMIFTHLGEIKQFEEQPINPETQAWSGGQERYYLSQREGITTLRVHIDVIEAFADYFDKTFPLALAYVKELAENFYILVETEISATVNTIWEKWTNPTDILQWNFAGDDWHCPRAANDLRPGGKFCFRMEAKDGSFGFDFEGTYTTIFPAQQIDYSIADGRKVVITFEQKDDHTKVVEKFEPETMNPFDLQRTGWQMILEHFKKYVES